MSKNQKPKTKPEAQAKKPKLPVKYQFINGSWYAFCEVGGETYFGEVPPRAYCDKVS